VAFPGEVPVFVLRAAVAEDVELLWRIQKSALGAYVEADFGTDEAQQRAYFDAHFDWLRHEIVQVEGRDAGYLMWEVRADHVYLANMALLPEFQRRGVGAALLGYVVGLAEKRRLPVRLQVLLSNPARNFYERHGFEVVGKTSTHLLMRRALASAGPVVP
jgi:ribosomal protein S18 acetylase RimI-like enzyme